MSGRYWQIVDSVEFPLLITTGLDGFPQVRPMTLLLRDGATAWFATSRRSAKVAQVTRDARVTVLFASTERFNYATLFGRAEIVDDAERRRTFWRETWRDDWPAGPQDEDYVLLKVVGERGAYYHGQTGETGGAVL
jgi:general stress protein 26